jgi:hypothetical protein
VVRVGDEDIGTDEQRQRRCGVSAESQGVTDYNILSSLASPYDDRVCEMNVAERAINLWDIAAGVALVRAASGYVAWRMAADVRTFTVYAGGHGLPALRLA